MYVASTPENDLDTYPQGGKVLHTVAVIKRQRLS